MNFYCNTCQGWTESAPNPGDNMPSVCVRCGESHQCGECGFEINLAGECQRNTAGAGECPTDALDPLSAWYRDHAAAAEAEGWSLFETSGTDGHDPIEVERIDEAEILSDDIEAWAIVARADTPHARAAIRVLRVEGCRREIGYLRQARREARS